MDFRDFFGKYLRNASEENFVTPLAEDSDPKSYAACCREQAIEGGRISYKSLAALLERIPQDVEDVLNRTFFRDEDRFDFLQDSLLGDAKEWFYENSWRLKSDEDVRNIIRMRVDRALALRNLSNVLTPEQENQRERKIKQHQKAEATRLALQKKDILPTQNLEYQRVLKDLKEETFPETVAGNISRMLTFFQENSDYTCFDDAGEMALINALDFLKQKGFDSVEKKYLDAIATVIGALKKYVRKPTAQRYIENYFEEQKPSVPQKMRAKIVPADSELKGVAEIINYLSSEVSSLESLLRCLTKLQNLIKSRQVNMLSPEAQERLVTVLGRAVVENLSPEPTVSQWRKMLSILEDCKSVCFPDRDAFFTDRIRFVTGRLPQKEKWVDDIPTDYEMGLGQFGDHSFKPPKPWGQDFYEEEKPAQNPGALEKERLKGLWRQFLVDIKNSKTPAEKARRFYALIQIFYESSCFFLEAVSVDSLLITLSTYNFETDLKTLRKTDPEVYSDSMLGGLFLLEELFDKYQGNKKALVGLRKYLTNLQP